MRRFQAELVLPYRPLQGLQAQVALCLLCWRMVMEKRTSIRRQTGRIYPKVDVAQLRSMFYGQARNAPSFRLNR